MQIFEPEGEHSGASVCEGFARVGGRVTNFTAGQDLDLIPFRATPRAYDNKAAGKRAAS